MFDGHVPRWAPQPGPQTEAICATWCEELFYGGAAGGGKTDFLLGDYLQDVEHFGPAWPGILFRRSMPELEEVIARSHEIFPATGAIWREQNKRWTWPNGAKLRLRYLEADRDATRYQGGAFSWIGWDELGQHPSSFGYKYLRGRLRSAHPVPRKRIRSAANPGGVGHHWVKAKFIERNPMGMMPFADPETGQDTMFIRAHLRDNQILMKNDPLYRERLKGMGSEALVRAWLEGDWDIIAGAFFPEFSVDRHVIAPCELPKEWIRFRSMDWGSARPFSVHWWAISDGVLPQFPRGALINYREWYGMKPGEPNVGLRKDATAVAEGWTEPDGSHVPGIVSRETGDHITYGVLDPAAWISDGGPSIAERLNNAGAKQFRRADNARVQRLGAMGGWDQVRQRLRGDEDGRPMIYFFSTSTHMIRTLPALQHDQDRPEDVDTESEDHAPDDCRYACMSRPWVPENRPAKEPVFRGLSIGGQNTVHAPTVDQIWADHGRYRERE